MSKPLLEPFHAGSLDLKNRVVMAPMTRSRADNAGNVPGDLQATYYAQRASAGLIITEGSQVSPLGVGYINTPGIYSPEQVEGWKKTTQAVHEKGGKIFIQIWHVGAISHPDFHQGALPISPSGVNPEQKVFTPEGFKETVAPREMTLEDIQQVKREFVQAAKNAVEAGFDGIEIHSSNGYLFHQFFNPYTNHRTDQYGGSAENRARILFELLEELKAVIPLDRVGVRLNPSAHGLLGSFVVEDTIPTFDYIVEQLNEFPLAYLHLSEPFTDVSGVEFAVTEIAKRYRPKYRGNLIINRGFSFESGNQVIEDGLADLVAFGVPFIANPDLVHRFETGAELAAPDKNTFYTPGEKGYIDYPALQPTE
ncbi:alkene reductase [Pontibacter sp. G13]|uniref:alkene reductase n=1 Tax=Pontibacter sp. G13 TaxID=3074898 RepID=UPI002889E733|nr:alkene reductase [Pontibacter sp. G13]WNJ19216.1 alkene reductase [Pontibacter sp. G13]